MTMCMSRGCRTKSHIKLLNEGKGLLPSQATYLVVVPGLLGDNLLCYESPMITAHVAHNSATFMAIKETYVDVESWSTFVLQPRKNVQVSSQVKNLLHLCVKLRR